MRELLILSVGILFLSGCASSETKHAAKKIHERPWIGGTFERVATPASVRTNGQHFAGHGLLITRAREETPIARAGLQEGDVILTVNGKNVRFERDIQQLVDRAGTGPVSATIYRAGEISEKSISPGVERYQELHHVVFGIGVATYMVFDLFPNPDFSLVALGYETKAKRLDLQDPSAKYRRSQGEYLANDKDGWQGLQSAEGWKAWLGPVALSESKLIISQESPR